MNNLLETGTLSVEQIKLLIGDTLPEGCKKLMGDDSEDAWKIRSSLFSSGNSFLAIASMAGVYSSRSRRYAVTIYDIQHTWWPITRALIGDNSPEAWTARDYLFFDSKVGRIRGCRISCFRKKIGILEDEWTFNLRARCTLPPGWMEPGDVLVSLAGIDSEKAWTMREKLESIAPAEFLISLAGLKSERSEAARKKYSSNERLSWAYKKSLIGINNG